MISYMWRASPTKLPIFFFSLFMLQVLSSHDCAADDLQTGTAYLRPSDLDIQYFEDTSGELRIEDILSPAFSAEAFSDSENKIPGFGAQHAAYWFRFEIVNQHPSVEHWWLEVQNPLLDRIELYQIDNNAVSALSVMGDGYELDQRPVPVRNPVFPIYIEKDKRQVIYMRVVTTGAVSLPLALWQPEYYVAGYSRMAYALGLYYGAIIALLLYNLFIYLGTRDKNYLFYCLFVGSYGMFQFCMDGMGYEVLFPEGGQVNLNFNYLMGTLATMGMLQFSRSFLHIDENFPRFNLFMKSYTVFALCFLLWLIPGLGPTAIRCHALMSLTAAIIVAIAAGVSIRRGVPEAKLFLLAWLFFICGIIQFDLMLNGAVPYNFFTVHSIQVGSFIEAVLLSLVLAYRVRTLTQENTRIEREAKVNLESKVRERTRALDEAMKELSRSNKVLEEMGLVDGLTGVRNRHFFEEQLQSEWSRCQRAGTPMSLLMIDIDHFKTVNDRFGHIAGDRVLCEVAKLIQSTSKRPSDFVSRYGGEEFAVVMPLAPAERAMALAEEIRECVAGLSIAYNQRSIQVTVSIGCACTELAAEIQTPAELIELADAALYRSKDRGRNRVTLSGD